MKTSPLVTLALAAILGASLTLPPTAALAGAHGPRWEESGDGPGGGRWQKRLAEILDLSAEQQAKIEAIRVEEQKATEAQRQALTAGREKLHALSRAETFDEAAVRSLAAEQAAARTELIVSRARMQHKIHAVLSPEQRVLAEKLRPKAGDRRGHRPPPDFDDGGM